MTCTAAGRPAPARSAARFRSAARVVLALSTLGALACGDATSAPADDYARAEGTYNLVALNGRPLPSLLIDDPDLRVDLTSATFVLRRDRTFTETLTARVTRGTGEPRTEQQAYSGTYTLDGAAAAFSVPPANGLPAFAFDGSVSGDVLTYTDVGASYRYERP